MNLQKLQSLIGEYKRYLQSRDNRRQLYKWETVSHFQRHWDTESADLAGMYDRALDNGTSRRQWVGGDFFPKEMMLKLIRNEPEYARLAFRDLFHEGKDVAARVHRFLYYCDVMFEQYRERYPYGKETGHYHDHGMAMFYLSCRFPEKYAPYDQAAFADFLNRVGARNIPQGHDVERFVKVCRTLLIFLGKDPAIQTLSDARLSDKHYPDAPLLNAHELMMVVG